MKLKFKATAQDWTIFGCFMFLLLIVVAILVVNINSVAIGEGFVGINPLRAFTPKMLPFTIFFYIVAIVGLFLAVKSYFFEREKGVGFLSGEKDETGYSRWATDKEMKSKLSQINIHDPVYKAAGFPIVNDGVNAWVDDGESHNLVIGSTGTGKTQCVIHPLVKILAKKGESMIVTDPKGEIYRESAGLLKQRGYKIVVLNFRDPQRGNTWNPLALPYNLYKSGNTDKAMELLDDLAANILYEPNGNQDPFWEKTSADYFVGLGLGLFKDAKPEEININSINLMANVGEEKFNGRSNYIKEYFNDMDQASAAYTCASGTVFAPEETKGSILSTFKQKLRLFASRENLSEMLSSSDFDMAMIGKQKTAIFMIIQDEKKTYHALATIFIKQCYESLIDVAQHCPKGELPVRTNFILDEFANMPPLKDITTMITAARSRLIRFTMIIQNFAQLDSVYGKDDAQTIRSNCNNLLYLLTTELAALKEISELCGEKKVKVGKGDKEHEETRPLATVSDLQKMKMFQAIVIRIRCNPFKTKLVPNYEINWGIPKLKADEFIYREKKPISVFDLKKFVTENRNNKFMNMLKEDGSGENKVNANPFMSAPNPFMGPNPFMNKQEKPEEKPFDVDELVRKIDAKIAELEAEEKAEEEKKKQQEKAKEQAKQQETKANEEPKNEEVEKETKKETSDDKLYEQPDFLNELLDFDKKDEGIIKDDKKIESKVSDIYNSNITDDQFFDDFFDE